MLIFHLHDVNNLNSKQIILVVGTCKNFWNVSLRVFFFPVFLIKEFLKQRNYTFMFYISFRNTFWKVFYFNQNKCICLLLLFSKNLLIYLSESFIWNDKIIDLKSTRFCLNQWKIMRKIILLLKSILANNISS